LTSTDFLRPVKHLHFGCRFLRAPFQSVLVSSTHKSLEQRMRFQRLRLELGMELAPNEMRMVGKLDHLHIGSIRSRAGNPQSARGQGFFILAVEFVTMPV